MEKNTIVIDAGGVFSFDEKENIIIELSKVSHVKAVSFKPALGCV